MDKETTSFKELWNSIPALVRGIIVIVIVILISLLIWRISQAIKARKTQDLLQNNIVTHSTQDHAGNTIVQTIDLGSRVIRIDNAVHHYWGGENESEMIAAIYDVPKELIPKLSDLYFQYEGNSLKDEYNKYLSEEDWNKVAEKFS